MYLMQLAKKKTIRLINRAILRALKTPEIQVRLSELRHIPRDLAPPIPGNIRLALWKKATIETAEYVENNMLTAVSFNDSRQLLKVALSKACKKGLYLELGVATGATINFIAERVEKQVHGFDSFEGLPEAWFDEFEESSFSTDGKLPEVRENVELHAGLFDKTLPEFVSTHQDNVALMHIDCDIYSSTKTVFNILGNQITSGAVIQFDEYFNYPGWKQHEYRAFQEMVAERDLKYEYLGYNRAGFSVAVRIL